MLTTRQELKHRVDALRRIPFLALCTSRQLVRIDRLGTLVDVRAGRTLTHDGEIGRQCFVVLDGVAVAQRDGWLLGEISSGSIAGEMALLDRARRNATVVARTAMRLVVLSGPEFTELLSIARCIEVGVCEIAEERRAAAGAVS